MNSSSEPDYRVPLKNPNGILSRYFCTNIPSYCLQKYRRKSVRVLDLESVYINARQKHPKGRARVVVNMKYTLYNIIIFANKANVTIFRTRNSFDNLCDARHVTLYAYLYFALITVLNSVYTLLHI